MMFVPTSAQRRCKYCKKRRYRYIKRTVNGDLIRQPHSTITQLPLRDQLEVLIHHEATRKDLMYRSTFTPSSDGTYRDIYDGGVYRQLGEEGLFSNDLNIALLLFNDGFTAKERQLTILNMVILNFSPLIRYENKRMIQLAIIPGPNEP